MGFYTGQSGAVVFNGKPVAKIRDWSLETSVELLSTNTVDSTSNTYVPSVKGASGSATLLYYRLEPGESANFTEFTELLGKIHKVGAITTNDRVLIQLRTSQGLNDDINFNAYITSAQIAVTNSELVSVPIQFTVDGDFLAGGVVA